MEIRTEEGVSSYSYAELAMSTSIEMHGLKIKHVYTTDNEESSSEGAMTLTCEANGVTIFVRTAVLYNKDSELVTEDAFWGKTIDVKGVVDFFDGQYQIKVLTLDNINIYE